MELKVNQKAPAFSLPDQKGKTHKLSDYTGKYVLVYFYPKDNTPGCTKEACAIRDDYSDFKKLKAVVLGISADSIEKHKNFADKHELPFTLLSDESKNTIKKYNAWGQKKMMGRTFEGIKRISYLINPQGKIVKIYETVKPAEHAKQVIEDLKNID